MKVKIKKLHPDAVVPTYATGGSACFDLYANLHEQGLESISDCDTTIIGTGLAFEIPTGWQMLIFSRSGHGFKENTRLANCVGVIDSDYRGEVKVKLTRDDDIGYIDVNHGDRIAQAQLMPVYRVEFKEVDGLSDTERGTGGFGSTGS